MILVPLQDGIFFVDEMYLFEFERSMKGWKCEWIIKIRY